MLGAVAAARVRARALNVAATVLPRASRWTKTQQLSEYRGRGREFIRGWQWTHRATWIAS
jgi:hypothetical protein